MGSRKGFTLIELLVVISIILVLASILTPALLRARESANRSTCLANIRSIGQAMYIYAGENNDKYPVAGVTTSTTGSTLGTTDGSFGMLYNAKTFNDTKVYVCPDKKRSIPPTWTASSRSIVTDASSVSPQRIISYCIVACDNGAGAAVLAVNPMITDNGSNAIIIEDPGSGDVSTMTSYDDTDNHGVDGTNVYCINGQAKWFRGAKVGAADSSGLPDWNKKVDGITSYSIGKDHIIRQEK